jgi:protein-arginine kinase activator protein McsA
MTKNVHCQWCEQDVAAGLHIQFFTNGSTNFLWVCSHCKRGNPTKDREQFISKEKVLARLSPAEISALPILMPQFYNRCVVCGDRDCELHHWSPRAIFGAECENWPKDYLCKSCHAKWHKIVTPQLVKSNV